MRRLYLRARLFRLKTFLIWEVPHGLKNLWRFRSEVWNHCDYDFNAMLRLMQKSSRLLSDHIKKHNVLCRSDKSARQALIFSELCRRIADEEVYRTKSYFKVPRGKDRIGKESRYIYRYNYDVAYLSKMAKFIPYWWD